VGAVAGSEEERPGDVGERAGIRGTVSDPTVSDPTILELGEDRQTSLCYVRFSEGICFEVRTAAVSGTEQRRLTS
jgi:hypothetical protein